MATLARIRARAQAADPPLPAREPAACPVCGDIGFIVERPATTVRECQLCHAGRAELRFARLLTGSGIPRRWWDRDFTTFASQPNLDQAARAVIDELTRQEDGPQSMYLHGANGFGKTGLAIAALLVWLRAGIPCRYWYETDLLDAINPVHDDERQGPAAFTTLAETLDVPVLLIDDLGARKPSAWSEQEMTRIVDHRLGALKATLITSNYPLSLLADLVSVRCMRRLTELCEGHVIAVGGG